MPLTSTSSPCTGLPPFEPERPAFWLIPLLGECPPMDPLRRLLSASRQSRGVGRGTFSASISTPSRLAQGGSQQTLASGAHERAPGASPGPAGGVLCSEPGRGRRGWSDFPNWAPSERGFPLMVMGPAAALHRLNWVKAGRTAVLDRLFSLRCLCVHAALCADGFRRDGAVDRSPSEGGGGASGARGGREGGDCCLWGPRVSGRPGRNQMMVNG